MTDFEAITLRQRNSWAAADFNQVGMRVMAASESICDAACLRAGQKVLDVACGGGNAALIAARRYCDVTGLDFVPALIDRAKLRAQAEGVEASFLVADAQALPFADQQFDAVLSVFGVMFAPDQERTAQELARVCKPGGVLALASWMPEHYGGALLGTYAKYAPPAPEGLASPLRWGTSTGLEELLLPSFDLLSLEKRTLRQYYRSTEHVLSVFLEHFGPLRAAYGLQNDEGRLAFAQDLRRVFELYDREPGESVMLECQYLEAVARRR